MIDLFPGDLVLLVSGGPLMTVRLTAGPWVEADWFAGSFLQTARFRAEMLALVEPVECAPEEPAPKPTTH